MNDLTTLLDAATTAREGDDLVHAAIELAAYVEAVAEALGETDEAVDAVAVDDRGVLNVDEVRAALAAKRAPKIEIKPTPSAIAATLRDAASLAWQREAEPATDAQCTRLAALLHAIGCTERQQLAFVGHPLTKRAASRLISTNNSEANR